MTPADVRKKLVHALGLDLVGPDRDDSDLLGEVLPQAPSRWYLTGFLVPTDAAEDDRCDDTADEGNEAQGNGGIDDNAAPEPSASRRAYFPSSMGMSLLVAKGPRNLRWFHLFWRTSSCITLLTTGCRGITRACHLSVMRRIGPASTALSGRNVWSTATHA